MLLVGCKRDFDTPDPIVDPNLTPTHTLAAFKARHTTTGSFEKIEDDVVLAGVVVADDRSGNLYKTIYIQDATGGLTLSLDRAQLYGDYPVGRKIYIKAKGLYIYDYANMITLGILDNTNPSSPTSAGIPSQLLDNYIIKGSLNNPVVATPVTVAQLTTGMQDKYLGTLIELDGYEFELGDTRIPYADTTLSKSAGERYIKPCTNASAGRIMIRTSAYSNFAALRPAAGNGKVWAIYTVFRTTKQLVIRDTSDVKFTNARCGSNVAIPTNLKALRELKDGATVPEGTTLNVIAISNNLNEANGNIIIQDATAGITMRLFNINYSFPTELTIDFSNATLATFNGTLQVTLSGSSDAERQAKVKSVGTKAVTPPVKTVLQTLNEYEALIGTLVKINDVTITKGTENATGTNYTIKDATGEILTFVRVATSVNVPVGKATSITGYVSQFSGVGQLVIRAESDIVGGGQPGGDPGTGTGSGIDLGATSPLTIDFNTLGTALPKGVTVRTGATATALGTTATPNLANQVATTLWKATGGGFKNFASATGLASGADSTAQVNNTNRALGLRQTGSVGDPGGAFVFELNNTTGKNNLKLQFLLQSLDETSTRTVTWAVDYGTGATPTTFTTGTLTGTATTGGTTFSNNTINVDFGTALNNVTGPVWIRIVALSASTGSSNKPSSTIDDVRFSWN